MKMAPSNNRTRTGTGRVVRTAGSVTLRTPITRTRARSSESVSTNASSSNARKGTQGTGTSGGASSKSEVSKKKPKRPSVEIGPKSYKVFKNGDRLVIRFSVGQMPTGIRGVRPHTGPYYVWDMDTGKVAARTSKTGYEEKQEAVRIAQEYRDMYGAYVRFKF